MNLIKIALLVVCGYFVVDGYNATTISTPSSITVLDEVIPQEPTEGLKKLLNPLDTILAKEPQDALILGRVFKQWAVLIGRSEEIKDLNHFTNRYKEALRKLFSGTEIKGKYHGEIDKVLDAAYKYTLDFLYQEDGSVSSYEVTPKVRAALQIWCNACSWKFYDCFLENIDASITE